MGKAAEADRLVITVITDNYYDALRPDTPVTKRFRARPGISMHAEHGLAFFVEATLHGRTRALMFDYGLDAQGVQKNMDVLGLDVGKADAFALSHGHFDHWGGLVEILSMNRTRVRKGTPLYLGRDAFEKRYALVPGTTIKLDLDRLREADIEALGLVKIVEVREPMELIPGAYSTGTITRVTAYEKSPPVLFVEKDGAIAADTFPGEQALVFNVRGRGLVVLSGCAHSGIVNTVMQAKRMTGVEKVHAVVGGFHLVNAGEEIIRSTIRDMKSIDPDYLVPAHCTGFEASMAFAKEMPGKLILNTAGTVYTFGE